MNKLISYDLNSQFLVFFFHIFLILTWFKVYTQIQVIHKYFLRKVQDGYLPRR